jgi:hypothetical protein
MSVILKNAFIEFNRVSSFNYTISELLPLFARNIEN